MLSVSYILQRDKNIIVLFQLAEVDYLDRDINSFELLEQIKNEKCSCG
jgi:hypothetical protein